MNNIAWHYTIGNRFVGILAAGVIVPATAFVPRRERPIVWFSTCDTYEPTACKSVMSDDGTVTHLGIEDTARLGGGLVRLGVDVATLIPWRRLPVAARMKPLHARKLEEIARKKGSDPDAWYGTFEPVPIAKCIVEVERGGQWIRVQPKQ